jgi:hypothetical protein
MTSLASSHLHNGKFNPSTPPAGGHLQLQLLTRNPYALYLVEPLRLYLCPLRLSVHPPKTPLYPCGII